MANSNQAVVDLILAAQAARMAAIVSADLVVDNAPASEDATRILAEHAAAIAAADAAYAAAIAPFQPDIDGWRAVAAAEDAEFASVAD